MTRGVVLSIFPGVGLLDAAFEAEGFVVVRGPDPLWGGDIRRFVPPPGVFAGVIGGPPCQDFSTARRCPPTGEGLAMLVEFSRVVTAARPRWWLLENVDAVPDVRIDGYSWQRVPVEAAWWCNVRRLRHVQFGSVNTDPLSIPRGSVPADAAACVMACDSRSFEELRQLQGLPESFDLPGFTREAKAAAVGNGVPFVMGLALARAVRAAIEGRELRPVAAVRVPPRRCACTCGAVVTGQAVYAGPSCRKRAQRRRDRDAIRCSDVTVPASTA